MTMIEKKARLGKYKNGDPAVIITFPFNRKDLNKVKLIHGIKHSRSKNIWYCPLNALQLDMLKGFGWDVDPELYAMLKQGYIKETNIKPITEIAGLKMELYPYQSIGVSFLETKKGNALIADEMGLGKTVQVLAWLQLHPELTRILIIVPASVKLNWRKEARLWMEKPKTQILEGKKPYPIEGRTVIINYDILPAWKDIILAWNPQVIVADEVHYIKNNKALRTKAVKKIAKNTKHFIALSGTPIINKPIEFYNTLQLVDRTLFPNWWEYTEKYCNRKNTGFGWDNSGAMNTEELHEILVNTVMLRRLKKDVLKELPDKTRDYIPMEIPKKLRKEYNKAEQDFIEWVTLTKGTKEARKVQNAEALAKIEALKQLSASAKLPNAIEWIHDFLETGEKLIVFATHKFVIDALMDEFTEIAVKIDGRTNTKDRQNIVEKFQSDHSIRLFVGNIKAAGIGITLTEASNVAFLELPWTSGELVQAEDRCHRIGQENAVTVYYLLAENTIDEKIAKLLDDKRKILDSVLDGKVTEEQSLLTQLIAKYEINGE
jgi:SWI/SNF-related matrix-associated actin-dependent regulator 1 of chromatin subfamily A